MKSTRVSSSTRVEGVSAPCLAVQGGWGGTFPEREPGLAQAPGAHVTPAPHPSLLQGTAKAKPSSGQDYVYWVDPRRGSKIQTWGSREGVERGPRSRKGQMVTIAFISPSL